MIFSHCIRNTSLTAALCTATLLTSCGSSQKSKLAPMAGEIRGNNPAAATIASKAANQASSGKSKAAGQTYKKLFKKYPHSSEASLARYQYAKLKQVEGDLIDSFDAYQTFIVRHPSNRFYNDALAQQSKVAHAAADGSIKNNFIGLKTKIDPGRIDSMLRSVISNAPRANTAAKAQFAIANLWQSRGRAKQALTEYHKMVSEYPQDSQASEAQYRIGMILVRQSERGNQDSANIQSAQKAFADYLTAYPSGPRRADVRKRLSQLKQQDIENSFNIAQFYEKKNQIASAQYYYREVIRTSPSAQLRQKAQLRLNALNN